MTRIEELKDIIAKANNAYYNTDTPIMEDAVYDSLVNELEKLEDCSTERVGTTVLEKLNKAKLTDKPMLSLKKVYTAEEVCSFCSDKELVATIKCDGLSTRIIYENGNLVRAITRGDGYIGVDVTEHVKQFKNVPLHIPTTNRVVVDGESIIKINDFNVVNKNNEYKNPRNLAAGTLNSLDTKVVKDRLLSFICWDVIVGCDSNLFTDRIAFVTKIGLETFSKIGESFAADKDKINDINNDVLSCAKEEGVPCDGVVWRINDLAYGDSLGQTEHHFKNAIAWKPEVESYPTKVTGFEWNVGRTGVLTPVVTFEPIEIDGSTVSKASVHNISILHALLGEKPYVNEKIQVYKANLIIPQILSAQIEKHNEIELEIPRQCPCCGKALTIIKENESEMLYCLNPTCEGKLTNRINHAVSDEALNIKGLSSATIEKLIDWGWVNELSDIFNLKEHKLEWINKTGFGENSVNKVLNNIEEARTNVTLDKFINSLNILNIGKKHSNLLAETFGTYEAFRASSKDLDRLSSIEGFGPVRVRNIIDYNFDEADKLYQYVTIVEKESQEVEGCLNGLVICATGKFEIGTRGVVQAIIESNGGTFAKDINKKVNLVVCGGSAKPSNKILEAQKRGTRILTENQFFSIYKCNLDAID